MSEPNKPHEGELSIARLALFAMGAATLVLAVVTVLIAVLRPGPGVGLAIVGIGLVAAIAAMRWVSNSMIRKSLGAEQDVDSDAHGGAESRRRSGPDTH